MLVSEHATCPIHALLCLVKRATVLALELLIVAENCGHCELILTMSESTLVLIATFCCLDPVLAELSLVLSILVGHHLHLRDVTPAPEKLRKLLACVTYLKGVCAKPGKHFVLPHN